MHRPARLISNKKKERHPDTAVHQNAHSWTHTHTGARTYTHPHRRGTNVQAAAVKTHRRTHTHRGRQVFQHITGSVAHIGMDYHIVTLRLTPTDNKLYRDVRWGRRKEAAKEET